jgi:hypothetical protein
MHTSHILLGSLAEVKEPAKLAAQVQWTAMPSFWISGKVGVLLSTSEIVYEWPLFSEVLYTYTVSSA